MTAALIIFYLIIAGAGYWLKYLNLTYLKAHGKTVPSEFEGTVDSSLLQKITAYTFENSRAGIVESIIGNVLLLFFLFGGLLGAYDRWIASLTGSFIMAGALFALILLAAETLIDSPFSLYRNFRIENRYGFNTMTAKLWSIDLIKALAISAVLGTLVTVAALSIVQASPA